MQTAIYRNLGDNLIRRQATKADANAIGDFIAKHHYDTLGVSMRDWMLQDTPLLSASDVVLVEDTTNGNIVSSAALFNRTWRYGDIEFGVGLSESVATEEVYRGRGLMRAVYNGLHQLSAAKGQLVQTVVGIPYFYRHFGYEYALDEHNTRTVHLSDVPTLREGESELFTIRPATLEDISTLAQLYERQCQDRVVIMVRDEATWRFLITDASLGALTISLFCILDADGNTVGYFGTWGKRAGGYDMIREIAVVDGVSLHNVLPTVLRSIKAHVLQASANNPDWTPTKIFFSLGIDHAVYDVLGNKISPHRPSSWYIRVPDLPAFLQHTGPVLEQRLAQSVMSGYSGNINLSFYKNGIRLTFEKGKLLGVSDWQPPNDFEQYDHADINVAASFAPLVFLKLLFGYRSLDELDYAYPDCWFGEEGKLMMYSLFPKQKSWTMY